MGSPLSVKNLREDLEVAHDTAERWLGHVIWVYNPGVTLSEVKANVPAAGLFVNYNTKVFAKGVNPGTPPAFADASVNPSGVQNRTESFGFSVPGRYLVICNVRGHFLDGMYAWINVVDGDDDRDRDREE